MMFAKFNRLSSGSSQKEKTPILKHSSLLLRYWFQRDDIALLPSQINGLSNVIFFFKSNQQFLRLARPNKQIRQLYMLVQSNIDIAKNDNHVNYNYLFSSSLISLHCFQQSCSVLHCNYLPLDEKSDIIVYLFDQLQCHTFFVSFFICSHTQMFYRDSTLSQ